MKKIPKILVLGYGRHGKDTFVEILLEHFNKENKLKFYSASLLAAELFIFDELKGQYGYKSAQECYDDRHNHRVEWHELISDNFKFCKYNDKPTLTEELMLRSDFYVGMRDESDFNHTHKLFDLIVWVDASKRLEPEDKNSCKLDSSYADIIIENNGTYEEFEEKVINFGKIFYDDINYFSVDSINRILLGLKI